VLPDVIAACDVQFVLSPTALTRAWCCYELGLYNQRFSDGSGSLPNLRSLVRSSTNYGARLNPAMRKTRSFWKSRSTSSSGGTDGLDAMLMQASLLGV
jgi:hypothetical protein